jgi:hypothetical protein
MLSDGFRESSRSTRDAREHRSHSFDDRFRRSRGARRFCLCVSSSFRVCARRAVLVTAAELIDKACDSDPERAHERLQQKAKEHDIYIQSGSMLEVDPKWPGPVFNTTCLHRS